MNQILELNNQKYLVRKSNLKLVLYQLPSLVIIHKYYAQIDYFYVGNQQILVLSKNVLTFIKIKCPPLRQIQSRQQYLEWQPLGGIPMQNLIVLYDKNTIAFYYRNPSLEKSWVIQLIQQIQCIKKSKNQKFIALKVKQPKNMLFLWEVGNMNKKPNQQIILKQQFVKWELFKQDTLCIQTKQSFNIYFVNSNNQHYIQYYISLQENFSSFCFLKQESVCLNSRRSVNTIAFLKPNGDIHLLELYDIQKRNKTLNKGQYNKISSSHKAQFINLVCGFQVQNNLIIIGESQLKQVKSLRINKHLDIQQIIQQKQQIGQNLRQIQYSNNRILFKDGNEFKLGIFVQNQRLQLLRTIKAENVLLSEAYLFIINEQQLHIDKIQIQKKDDLQFNRQGSHQFKYTAQTFIIFDVGNVVFFVNSIRCFKYSILQDKITPMGFVIKNQKAKLKQIRVNTKSLLYQLNQNFILIEYELVGEKIVFKNIKSSQNKLISLRINRWAQKTPKQIILGQKQKELCRFNLPKFYKSLLQQNNYYDYELYWITHGGIVLLIKNYIFFLQLIDDQNGYKLHLIKKGHSYLNKRFSSVYNTCKLIDARQMIFYTGSRFLKLNSTIQYFITQNPYDLCDTLLKRQLDMRSYYEPHHPKIILSLIQCNLFDQTIHLFKKVYKWLVENKTLRELYEVIQIQDYKNKKQQIVDENQEKMVVYTQQNNNQIIQQLRKFSQLIINHADRICLSENNPLILQSQVSSLIFCLQNYTSMDYFSRPVLAKLKIPTQKEKPFTTMEIAFLIHSINKQQTINYIKTEQIQWSWIVKYSIVLWYENIDQIKKYVQQIAMNQYRINKDPFDCLFWYILIGKKNLLIALFKQQKLNSKQHDSMHTFLQRNFSQQKNKSASIKNAYALIDKKRYMHALAFFILGDKIDECIRFILDRIKDLNLAYLVTIFYSNLKIKHVQNLLKQKGDVWAKHIGWFIQKKHVKSHNVLLQEQNQIQWVYTPSIKSYHPCLNEFAKKIKDSIPVKREIQQFQRKKEAMKQQLNQNQLQIEISKIQNFEAQKENMNEEEIQEQINADYCELQKKAINYYLKLHFPCLSLAIDKTNYEAKRAYQLQKYILAKNVSHSVIQIAQNLQDIISMLKNQIQLKNYHKLLQNLVNFRNNFQNRIRHVKINQLNPPLKHQIGQLLYYTYFSEKIINEFPQLEKIKEVQQQILFLKHANMIGKVTIGICLKFYSYMSSFLTTIKTKQFFAAQQGFWIKARQKYDHLTERKKQKHQKLMDSFQFSLNNHIKKVKQQNPFQSQTKLNINSVCYLHLVSSILFFLSKNSDYFREQLLQGNKRIDTIMKNWVQESDSRKLNEEFQTLYKQGIQARLKLKILPQVFQDNVQFLYQILKIVFINKFRHTNCQSQNNKQQNQNTKEKQAIEVFKNKSDHLKNFIINQNQGYGLQIAVLFKKGVKKIQVCESLANRDRSHDGLNLIHEDSFYNVNVQIDLDNIMQKQLSKTIQNAIQKTLCSRRLIDSTTILKKSIRFGDSDYMKSLDPIPYMDHNQLHSIQSHSFLPIFLLGGKGLIDVCAFSNLKNFNRIMLSGMSQIIKIDSKQNRVCSLDSLGNFSCINFDSKYNNKVIFQIKKNSIIDFCSLSPSIYAVSTQNNVQVFDSLLHPKRQNVFKIQLGSPIVSICPISDQKLGVLKKNQIQIYDIRMDHLEDTIEIGGRGRSIHFSKNKILVGRSDCRVKIFDIGHNKQETVKVGVANDDKDKVFIQQIKSFGDCYFCMKNDGSIYQFF